MNWMHTKKKKTNMWITIFEKYKSCTRMKNKRRNQLKEE